MPRQKLYENANARARAYQGRKRDERNALRALASKVAQGETVNETTITQLLEELPESQARALQRLASSQNSVTNLKKSAA